MSPDMYFFLLQCYLYSTTCATLGRWAFVSFCSAARLVPPHPGSQNTNSLARHPVSFRFLLSGRLSALLHMTAHVLPGQTTSGFLHMPFPHVFAGACTRPPHKEHCSSTNSPPPPGTLGGRLYVTSLATLASPHRCHYRLLPLLSCSR